MHFLSVFFGGLFMSLGAFFGFVGHAGAPTHAYIPPQEMASSSGESSAPAQPARAQSTPQTSASSGPQTAPPSAVHAVPGGGAIDLTALPLGDGKVSVSPKVGYVYSCEQTFSGGGAEHAGNWIHGSTWNLSEKLQVEGMVSWPNATFSNTVSGAIRKILGNGLPLGEPTGTFPIQRSDPAWQIDRNPNSVQTQTISYALPASPTFATAASCVPMGVVGVALDGVTIYNALDADGRDAVAHEVQDLCDGHPQGAGEYHYHGPSPCMPNVDKKDTVVGYALDGFPVTSLFDANGNYYTDAELDACHGTTGTYADENGATQHGYHYVLTEEYPYTIGCFRGTPVRTRPAQGPGMHP